VAPHERDRRIAAGPPPLSSLAPSKLPIDASTAVKEGCRCRAATAARAKARGTTNWASARVARVRHQGTGERCVEGLLKLSRAIDYVNDRFGEVANWLVLLACLISAGNAASRYTFSASSNAWLEVQWYMFAGMVLLGGPYTLKVNEHVRVDLLY